MATGDKGESLTYEQLLEMISAFQWLPEEKRFRLAREIDRNHGTGNQIFGCLLHYAAAIERMERRGTLNAAEIQVFLIKLAERYELVQRVDGDSVVMEVKRVVQAVGVDIVMIGKGNAFVTAFVLVLRRLVPMEWNAFCDYVEKVNWKVVLPHAGPQSRAAAVRTGETGADQSRSTLDAGPVTGNVQLAVETVPSPRVGGLALAFENQGFVDYADSILEGCGSSNSSSSEQVEPEPEQDNSSSGSVLRAENDTGGCLQKGSARKPFLR